MRTKVWNFVRSSSKLDLVPAARTLTFEELPRTSGYPAATTATVEETFFPNPNPNPRDK